MKTHPLPDVGLSEQIKIIVDEAGPGKWVHVEFYDDDRIVEGTTRVKTPRLPDSEKGHYKLAVQLGGVLEFASSGSAENVRFRNFEIEE